MTGPTFRRPPPTSGQRINEERIAAIRAEERERLAAVMGSEAAIGRERIAARLIADSEMSAEKIIEILPEMAATSSAATSMLALLSGQPNPNIATR